MQTFLPYSEFDRSMQVLDPKRLGNQVYREGMTLLRGGWSNHPASKMWRGYEPALAYYLWCGVAELQRRGKDYTDRPWYHELLTYDMTSKGPPWIGDDRVHSTHRANLLRKNYGWYSQFGWTEQPSEGYYWPEVP